MFPNNLQSIYMQVYKEAEKNALIIEDNSQTAGMGFSSAAWPICDHLFSDAHYTVRPGTFGLGSHCSGGNCGTVPGKNAL